MSLVRSIAPRLSALFLLAALAFPGWSQSDLSTITGTVKDSTGAAVPNAKVSVSNQGTGVSRETTTNDLGAYTVSNIPSGKYTVTVEAQGFKKYTRSDNQLDANVPLGVNITLEVGQISETVNVTAESACKPRAQRSV